MLGIEFLSNLARLPGDPTKVQSARIAALLHAAGLLAVPAGMQTLRFLPPLNLRRNEADEALAVMESVCRNLA